MPDTSPPPNSVNGSTQSGRPETPPPPPEAPADNTAATPTTSPSAPAKKYGASIHPGSSSHISPDLARAILELESCLPLPLWCLVQAGEGQMSAINEPLWAALFDARNTLPEGPIALLIESPGGQAKCAYQIAKLLTRKCGGFVAIVPRYAKSAATLLALGADAIMMGAYAELGPLDAQFVDIDRERRVSALEEVQALERLNAVSLVAIDQTMNLLVRGTRKRTDVLLPVVMRFVSDMMRPLLENIDAVQYSQRSRMLRVAEEYAIRLLTPRYGESAQAIASRLVEDYPDHNFAIDPDEAESIGLKLLEPSAEQAKALDNLLPHLNGKTVIGRVHEI